MVCPTVGQGIKTILIEETAALDGNGVYGQEFNGPAFAKPVINEAGQLAFTARLKETSGGFLDNHSLLLYDPETEELVQISRLGEKGPGTVGNYAAFMGSSQDTTPFLTLNDSGQIGVFASASGDWAEEGNAVDGTGDVVELRHADALPTDKRFYDVLVTSPDS